MLPEFSSPCKMTFVPSRCSSRRTRSSDASWAASNRLGVGRRRACRPNDLARLTRRSTSRTESPSLDVFFANASAAAGFLNPSKALPCPSAISPETSMDWMWIEIRAGSEPDTHSAWYEVVNGRLVLRCDGTSDGIPVEAGKAIAGFEGLSLEEARRRVESMNAHAPSLSMWRHYASPDWLALSTELSVQIAEHQPLAEMQGRGLLRLVGWASHHVSLPLG